MLIRIPSSCVDYPQITMKCAPSQPITSRCVGVAHMPLPRYDLKHVLLRFCVLPHHQHARNACVHTTSAVRNMAIYSDVLICVVTWHMALHVCDALPGALYCIHTATRALCRASSYYTVAYRRVASLNAYHCIASCYVILARGFAHCNPVRSDLVELA